MIFLVAVMSRVRTAPPSAAGSSLMDERARGGGSTILFQWRRTARRGGALAVATGRAYRWRRRRAHLDLTMEMMRRPKSA